jgi:hypothetical protein
LTDHINIYTYPNPLTPGDILTDGEDGTAFEIFENTLLIWADLDPPAWFAHPTAYVLISATGDIQVAEGEWWPVLNGERILYGSQVTATFPLKLARSGTEEGEPEAGYEAELEPPGGHAAERLREFIDQRYPDGIPYSPLPEDAPEAGGEEADVDASAEQGAGGAGDKAKRTTEEGEA